VVRLYWAMYFLVNNSHSEQTPSLHGAIALDEPASREIVCVSGAYLLRTDINN